MAQNWEFTENAKRVRREVYAGFLARGASIGTVALADRTGLSAADLAAAIEELERGLMVMCPPGTHDIAKCPPWTNVPTRHAIEVDGAHAGYAGCALEAMNIAYCYPGKVVTVRSSCPHTGTTITIALRGREQLGASPSTTVGHVGVDPAKWAENWFHACDHNVFFASPDALSAWEAGHPQYLGVMLTMAQLAAFASYSHRLNYERGSDDYGPRDGYSTLAHLGVAIPENWTRLGG